MTAADLLALAERCEAAPGPNFRLGCDVLHAVSETPEVAELLLKTHGEPTTSLNSCRRLHELLLPDARPTITFGRPAHVALYPASYSISPSCSGRAATPEMAWLAAILRALAAKESG